MAVQRFASTRSHLQRPVDMCNACIDWTADISTGMQHAGLLVDQDDKVRLPLQI